MNGGPVRQPLLQIQPQPLLGSAADCYHNMMRAKTLQQCGAPPKFTDVTAWLNPPNGTALNWSKLRGKVVSMMVRHRVCSMPARC